LYPTFTLGFRKTPFKTERGLSAWIRQHSDASTWVAARESEMARKRRVVLVSFVRKGDTGIATAPFQHEATGTGKNLSAAYLDLYERKYGHVDMIASCPLESLSAKVS
jgi:Lhr-like helicase